MKKRATVRIKWIVSLAILIAVLISVFISIIVFCITRPIPPKVLVFDFETTDDLPTKFHETRILSQSIRTICVKYQHEYRIQGGNSGLTHSTLLYSYENSELSLIGNDVLNVEGSSVSDVIPIVDLSVSQDIIIFEIVGLKSKTVVHKIKLNDLKYL